MKQFLALFFGTFVTLLAIINPLESLPVYLKLLEGKDENTHNQVAAKACIYAAVLMFGFLLFGNFMLKLFGVPLSMVRIVGGIILMRVGFDLFLPSGSGSTILNSNNNSKMKNIAFVPLAIPLMFAPGAIATIISMASLPSRKENDLMTLLAIFAAIVLTMFTTYLVLVFARKILKRVGEEGVDAATRIVGFFVSAIGMGLIFHGLISALQMYNLIQTSLN